MSSLGTGWAAIAAVDDVLEVLSYQHLFPLIQATDSRRSIRLMEALSCKSFTGDPFPSSSIVFLILDSFFLVDFVLSIFRSIISSTILFASVLRSILSVSHESYADEPLFHRFPYFNFPEYVL